MIWRWIVMGNGTLSGLKGSQVVPEAKQTAFQSSSSSQRVWIFRSLIVWPEKYTLKYVYDKKDEIKVHSTSSKILFQLLDSGVYFRKIRIFWFQIILGIPRIPENQIWSKWAISGPAPFLIIQSLLFFPSLVFWNSGPKNQEKSGFL